MTKQPTVFVLGAGASKPYGLPTGAELKRDILKGLAEDPYVAALEKEFPMIVDPHYVSGLRRRFFESAAPSIDRFLEFNQRDRELGQLLIAKEILRKEKADILFSNPDDDWLSYLWAKLSTKGLEGLKEVNVNFVTFNYDRSVEHFFSSAIRSLFGVGTSTAAELQAEHLPVTHVHGAIGTYTLEPQRDTDVRYGSGLGGSGLHYASKLIRIVSDGEASDPQLMRVRAHLKEATRVFFLGFGYHPENMLKIGMDDHSAGDGVYIGGSAMTLRRQERRDIEARWGVTLDEKGLTDLDFMRESISLG